MKLGVLFSGGKDSTLALHKAAEKEQITCLITLQSKNPESYMFHTPNIDLAGFQAEALGLPLVAEVTAG
jgi:diphthine-ammonia ligase